MYLCCRRPRRILRTDDPDQASIQIQWERRHLHLPGALTLFWFPAGSVQPIALFERGAALDNPNRLIVIDDRVLHAQRDAGCHARLLLRPAAQPAGRPTIG